VQVTENPADGLIGVTCAQTGGLPCAFTNGDATGPINQFHGRVLTFTNHPPTGGEGCTPGYWKQSHHFDSWTAPYDPTDGFNATFGIGDAWFSNDVTLLQALKLGGGGVNALARHAVAALLNAASGDVDYPMTTAQVIAAIQGIYPSTNVETLKNQLDANNNLGCPLN
jgi:hypothetical protein